jgi:hypothetical protein
MELYLPNGTDFSHTGYGGCCKGAKVNGDFEKNDVTLQDCIEKCNGEKECSAFTWYTDTQRCHLKTEIPYFCTGVENAISGEKKSQCNPTTTTTTTSKPTTTTTTTTPPKPTTPQTKPTPPPTTTTKLATTTTPTPTISKSTPTPTANKQTTNFAVIAMVVCAVAFLVIGAFCFLYKKQKNKTDNNPLESVSYNVEVETNTKVSTATFVDQVTSGEIPLTDEYSMLNNLDTRMHVLVFTSNEAIAHGLLNRLN